jgi:hypothetical protein
MKRAGSGAASIGLKAKTGRAIAVVLCGPGDSPRLLERADIGLVDPKIPATGQPHHEVMELPWREANVAVQPFVKAIEMIASNALARLVREIQSDDFKVCGVGIVGAGDRNLEKIGNPHIRAHAAEGVLFRKVLETAADRNGLAKRAFIEKELEELVASELKCTAADLKVRIMQLGRSAGPPWRADQRMAAMAAWLTLVTC